MPALREQLQEEVEDTQSGKFLVFSMGKEFYGLDIKYVTEIIGVQAITEVPGQPHYVMGIINLRGKIIPVVDVRVLFNKDKRDYDERTCTVVVEINEICLGLIVDRVSDVIHLTEENIIPAPNMKEKFQNRFIKRIGRIGEDVRLIIDCEKLLNEEQPVNGEDIE